MTPMAQFPDEWYYLDGSNPVGPFTRDVMRQLKNAGKITDHTSVACAGQNGWKPLAQHNLDPVPIVVPVPPPRNQVSVPTSMAPQPAAGGRKINWIPAMVFQCVGCLFGVISELGGDDESFMILVCMAAIGALVSWAFLHSACWKALPEHLRFTTPQRAVGFMFIPFYNFYWVFISFLKLAEGVTRWQSACGFQASNQLRTLAMAMAITHVCIFTIGLIPVLGSLVDIGSVIVFAMFYKQLTESLNQLPAGNASHA